MRININGKGVKITEALQQRIEEKLAKFNRIFGEDAQAQVRLSQEKETRTLEITLKMHRRFFRTECSASDFATALDQAVDVLEGQIRKNKTRLEKQIHDYAYMKEYLKTAPQIEESAAPRIIKRKSFYLEPMDAEEAALQMDLLGHDFLLYRDPETDKTCAVYRRHDGNYGVIEPAD